MNIEGLGESLIAQLIAGELMHDYADVYALAAAQLAGLTSTSTRGDGKDITRRFGEKNAAKVIAQIERSRSNELWRLIYGLGIRHIGERAAQVLARAFGSIDTIATATAEQLQATPEVGPVLAASVCGWLGEPRNRQLLDRLRAAGVPDGDARVGATGDGPPGGAHRQDLCHHWNAGHDEPGGRDGRARTARRQGRGLRQPENYRRGGGRRGGEQGRQGARSRRDDARRGGVPGADQSLPDSVHPLRASLRASTFNFLLSSFEFSYHSLMARRFLVVTVLLAATVGLLIGMVLTGSMTPARAISATPRLASSPFRQCRGGGARSRPLPMSPSA